MLFRFALLFSLFCFAALSFADIAPEELDARKIMDAAFERDTGDRVSGKLRMTITDAKGRKRVRELQSRAFELKEQRRTLLIFESPPDIRNTGLLTYDYDAVDKDDDQWLYLPGLGRTTRISSKGRARSFVGSDFSYADLTLANPDNYELKLLNANTEVQGEACWHIESVPKTEAERKKSGYNKTEAWISKKSLIALRMKAWMKGNQIKYISATKIEKIQGIWTPMKLMARTLRGQKFKSETLLEQLELRYRDPSVRKVNFTPRRLEQGL